ncbi:MAG: sigma-70 family RNA polymerase sigma factor [Armatimonadetes bacterium]|nr:sigma-70 family RNA polymerase sigma factor [Armatimonadota bacterium]
MIATISEPWPSRAPHPRRAAARLGRERPAAAPPAPDASASGFEALCAGCRPQLEAAARGLTGNPHDAADLVQEALVRAYRGFNTFQAGTNFQGWVLHILRNVHINEYRKRRGTEVMSWDDLAERNRAHGADAVCDPRGEPEQVVLGNVPDDEVGAALAGLSPDFRKVMELADVHDLSYPEIARHLNVPIGTVRSRLSRAREQMRHKLAGYAVRHGYLRRDELAADTNKEWDTGSSADATSRPEHSAAEAGSRTPVAVAGDLGGQTLTPGVFQSALSLSISAGDLILDARGDPRAAFVFRTASRLTVGAGCRVVLRGGAQAANVHWLVGGSAVLESGCLVRGSIAAAGSITLRPGAMLDGTAALEGGTGRPPAGTSRLSTLCTARP